MREGMTPPFQHEMSEFPANVPADTRKRNLHIPIRHVRSSEAHEEDSHG